MLNQHNVAISDKFLLSFEEASCYFGVGINKLRAMANNSGTPDWIVTNGSHRLIKRVRLEEILLKAESI